MIVLESAPLKAEHGVVVPMGDRIDCGQVLRDACRSARELQRRNEPLLPASSQLLAEDSARSSMAKSRRQEAEQFLATVGGARMEPVPSESLPDLAFGFNIHSASCLRVSKTSCSWRS